jgi:hypothetical protein
VFVFLALLFKIRPKTYLRLDQDQIDEEDDKIMLDILVGEAFAAWTLGQPYAFAESLVIGFAVGGVKCADRIPTFDAYRHCICFERFDPGYMEWMFDVMSDLWGGPIR